MARSDLVGGPVRAVGRPELIGGSQLLAIQPLVVEWRVVALA